MGSSSCVSIISFRSLSVTFEGRLCVDGGGGVLRCDEEEEDDDEEEDEEEGEGEGE